MKGFKKQLGKFLAEIVFRRQLIDKLLKFMESKDHHDQEVPSNLLVKESRELLTEECFINSIKLLL